MDQQQLLQRADAEVGFIRQLLEHIFGAIVKPGGHIVATQLLDRQQALIVVEGSALH